MSDSLKAEPSSISIGPNVKFEGSIYTPGAATVEGNVVGKLEAKDLLVGKTGSVSGDVTADCIDVHGELHKEVDCSERMVIHATGSVKGNLIYSELEVVRGGTFEGTMLQKDA